MLAVLSLLLLAKLFSGLEGYPPTWCDEIVYIEPAVNFVKAGHFAAPGIARQLETKGLKGLGEHYFLNVPLGAYARIAVYEIFGADQAGRRLADWLFIVLATAALLLALKNWVTPQATILAGIVFVLHRIVGDAFGRPDLLSLAFGLFAVWLVTQPLAGDAAGKPLFGRAFVTGLFIGLSGFSHQFGGVFWGVIVVAVQVTLHGTDLKLWKALQWLVFFGLGGLAVTLTWLPQIAVAPQAWQQQFFYLLNLKHHLVKSFVRSAHFLISDTIAKNPVACLMAFASVLVVKMRKQLRAKFRLTLLACLLLLVVWRCHAFEPYVRQYSIHFWALICILFAFVYDDWSSWLAQRFAASRAALLKNATIAVVILAGSLQTGIISIEAFGLPFLETRKAIVALLQNNISPDDQVLAGDAFYFDVPTRHKSVWYWSEKLDLNDYNVLVAQFPSPEAIPVSDGTDRDQWNNCFSPEQAVVFRRDFELVASVPGVLLPAKFSPPHYRPHVLGCYIYRNKHPHLDSSHIADPAHKPRTPGAKPV